MRSHTGQNNGITAIYRENKLMHGNKMQYFKIENSIYFSCILNSVVKIATGSQFLHVLTVFGNEIFCGLSSITCSFSAVGRVSELV